MTITKALRKLYKVIVGEEAPANANTITKVLLALAEAWTGSGGSGGGGAEPLIVRYDRTVVNGKTYTHYFDKTWQEVADALSNYIPVYIHGFAFSTEYEEFPHSLVAINTAGQEEGKFLVEGNNIEALQANSADGTLYVRFSAHQ